MDGFKFQGFAFTKYSNTSSCQTADSAVSVLTLKDLKFQLWGVIEFPLIFWCRYFGSRDFGSNISNIFGSTGCSRGKVGDFNLASENLMTSLELVLCWLFYILRDCHCLVPAGDLNNSGPYLNHLGSSSLSESKLT